MIIGRNGAAILKRSLYNIIVRFTNFFIKGKICIVHNFMLQAENFITTIHRIYLHNKNPDKIVNEKVLLKRIIKKISNLFIVFFQIIKYSIQLVHNKIEFYVCSLFPVNRSFIYSVCTYLTITKKKLFVNFSKKF